MAKKKVSVVLGDYPLSSKIRAISGDEFDFAEVKPVTEAFRPMLDTQNHDICEMASVTFLQGKVHGRRVHLLPIAMLARFQQRTLVYNTDYPKPSLKDLEHSKIGVRSYAQTTGVWVRGLMAHSYGVDLGRVNWISFEDAHVHEFRDPAGVERAPEGNKVAAWLQDGRVDAAIIGNELPKDDLRLKPLLDDPEGDAFRWHAKTGVVPINHLVVVSEDVLQRNSAAVAEFYRLAVAAKAAGGGVTDNGVDMNPIGFAAMEPSLSFLIRIATEQGLIPEGLQLSDLIEPRIREMCP